MDLWFGVKHSAVVVVLALSVQIAGAAPLSGSIIFYDNPQGSPSNPVLPTLSYLPVQSYARSTNACDSVSYEECSGIYFDVPTFAGLLASVQFVDDTTGQVQTFAAGNIGYFENIYYEDPYHAHQRGQLVSLGSTGSKDPNNGELILGLTFQNFQGFSDDGACSISGGCDGIITGGVQDAVTIKYLDGSGDLLGSDLVAFQGQNPNPPTPEPASILLLVSGLGVLGLSSLRTCVSRKR